MAVPTTYFHTICLVAAALFFSFPQQADAGAATPSLQSLYINPENQRLPEALIFYNSFAPCENCSRAADMVISTLRRNYAGRLRIYLIDTARHPEFIAAFSLSGPLTLVLVRISDGAAFGYTSLTGLQSQTGDAASFSNVITEKINNFLNLSPEN